MAIGPSLQLSRHRASAPLAPTSRAIYESHCTTFNPLVNMRFTRFVVHQLAAKQTDQGDGLQNGGDAAVGRPRLRHLKASPLPAQARSITAFVVTGSMLRAASLSATSAAFVISTSATSAAARRSSSWLPAPRCACSPRMAYFSANSPWRSHSRLGPASVRQRCWQLGHDNGRGPGI